MYSRIKYPIRVCGIVQRPYPIWVLFYMELISDLLRRPFRVSLDYFLCTFVSTSIEPVTFCYKCFKYILLPPLMLLLVICCLPLQLLGFLLWLPIQWLRDTHLYSVAHDVDTRLPVPDLSSCDLKTVYTFATANLCLLPECMSRYNNLMNVEKRAGKIAQIIAEHQAGYGGYLDEDDLNTDRCEKYWQNVENEIQGQSTTYESQDATDYLSSKYKILPEEKFPPVDFLLIQEGSWVKDYAEIMMKKLHEVYKHIIYDVGYFRLKQNAWISNSGLMFASKYPIVESKFYPFPDYMGQDVISSKGLLALKVYLGDYNRDDFCSVRVVGFIGNSHLQAHQGDNPVHTKQLESIRQWMKDFRETTHQPGEIVAFDTVGGDFNLDNMSPVDKADWAHSIFDDYKDLGRKGPGVDHPSVYGTEMRHPVINDYLLSTAAGLKEVLMDPSLCQYYILSPDIEFAGMDMAKKMPECDKDGNVILKPNGGKRRIDFLLFRDSGLVIPVAFHCITSLGNLTDHVPYCLALKVDKQHLDAVCDSILENI